MNTVVNGDLAKFIKSQKLLVLSTVDENGQPWISNVYFSADDELNLFFVSPTDTKHSKHIAKNPHVAFSIPWYDEMNLANRKAIQGIGACKRITSAKETIRLLKNHYQYYPLWKDAITYKAMREKLIESRPYVIKPTHMKFWNDELYGEEKVEQFSF